MMCKSTSKAFAATTWQPSTMRASTERCSPYDPEFRLIETRPTAKRERLLKIGAPQAQTAADLVERGVSETLTDHAFPDIHWQDLHQQPTRADHAKKFGRRDCALSEHCRTTGPV